MKKTKTRKVKPAVMKAQTAGDDIAVAAKLLHTSTSTATMGTTPTWTEITTTWPKKSTARVYAPGTLGRLIADQERIHEKLRKTVAQLIYTQTWLLVVSIVVAGLLIGTLVRGCS